MSSETEYRVLARKYRPSDFSDLVGQDPMVRTLTNAFSSGRIAQAWMLTGVRGVGKTTTARILARALNYQRDDINQPTIDIQELGEHCQAIMDGRHIDVVEMDAASHTGIDDIREIIEQVRYKPIAARYKVYIIDEVHMLSTQAFNGLLKTLEEPPAHVKFIFATTEIRKVPITVLSRCQRFDLRRIDASDLSGHFKMIAGKEGVEIDDESLALIARASEGSARDGLSLMDQAIAHGSGKVEAEAVRSMLGLADRTRIADLFDFLMKGDIAKALEEFKEQYDAGANPLVVLTDLADFTHTVTRLKYAPAAKDDTALTEIERTRGAEFGAVLSTPVLSRTWQMLLKAISETTASNRPFASAEMALIRIAHSAHLPSPEDLAKIVTGSEQNQPNVQSSAQSSGSSSVQAGNGANGGNNAPTQSAHAPSQTSDQQGGGQSGNGQSGNAPTAMLANRTSNPRGMVLHAIDNPNPQPVAVIEPEVPAVKIESLEDLVALADQYRDVTTKIQIRNHVRLINVEPGRLEISLTEQGSPTLPGELIEKLKKWTGAKWIVGLNREAGGPTLAELESEKQEALVIDAREDKDVAAILKKYPGARITDVRIAVKDDDFHFNETEDGDISPDNMNDDMDLPE